jgi:Zn-dependent protease
VRTIEIVLDWRWAPVLALSTWLLAQNILPARFPTWHWGTTWATAAAAVLTGEGALLLHELSHVAIGRARGGTRITFLGFQAQTVVNAGAWTPSHEVLTALAGPTINLVLAALAELARLTFATQGALDAFLLMLALGNAAAALLSLVPLGASDGSRALSAARRRARLEGEVACQRQHENDDDQQGQRRPAVVAPSAGAAKAATQ